MQDRERYQYRFINVHLITKSALDPTYNAVAESVGGDVTEESGKREWPFEKQTLTMTEEGAKDESKLEGKNGINPFSWIKGGNRLTRFAHKKKMNLWQSVMAEETDISDFEFPELTHSDEQEFVTNGALLFDSFDCWHGAAAWCEDKSFKKKLTDIDPKGRQPFHSADVP